MAFRGCRSIRHDRCTAAIAYASSQLMRFQEGAQRSRETRPRAGASLGMTGVWPATDIRRATRTNEPRKQRGPGDCSPARTTVDTPGRTPP